MKNEHIARATGRDLPVSTKHCLEIGNFIRGKTVSKAKQLLQGVLDMKVAVPMKRFNRDTGHKKGKIASGRFPQKACKEVLTLLESAEMNAQNKGLNTDVLFIKTYMANKGSSQWRYGRQRRRQMKRTNLVIEVEEMEVKKPKKETPKEKPKEVKKETPKPEVKPKEVKKEAPKREAPKKEKK